MREVFHSDARGLSFGCMGSKIYMKYLKHIMGKLCGYDPLFIEIIPETTQFPKTLLLEQYFS